jgi:hypothetical protein
MQSDNLSVLFSSYTRRVLEVSERKKERMGKKTMMMMMANGKTAMRRTGMRERRGKNYKL